MTIRSPFKRRSQASLLRAAVGAPPELLIYDEIGFFGIRAADVVRELQGLQGPDLTVRINSPGGDVTEGVAIYEGLRRCGATITVHIDGLAASIASVIAMAGTEIHMASTAFMMIHEAWGVTVGCSEEHMATAAILDKMDAMIAGIYAQRTGLDVAEVEALMEAETWMTAEEAVAAGFADDVTESGQPVARAPRFDLGAFKHAPAALGGTTPKEPSIRELEQLLRDAGLSQTKAKAFIASGRKALESQRDAGDAGLITRLEQFEATIQSLTGETQHV